MQRTSKHESERLRSWARSSLVPRANRVTDRQVSGTFLYAALQQRGYIDAREESAAMKKKLSQSPDAINECPRHPPKRHTQLTC